MPRVPSHLAARLQAVFVTFLWSTSWILIKIGLRSDLSPVTFAGLRYTLAFFCLAPFVLLNPSYRRELRSLKTRDWRILILLGVLIVGLTQALQYAALAYLPAAMTSLVLNLSSILVGIAGIFVLREIPSPLQQAGTVITILGVGLYFLPIAISGSQWIGITLALLCMICNVLGSLLGRHINRSRIYSPLMVTFVSMAAGSFPMLLIGILTQGMGKIAAVDWLIVLWLAVINTAFAFTVWNNTLQSLTAIEASVINSLMMPQIAVLAWLFLKENLTLKEILGLVLVGVGVLLVQITRIRTASREDLKAKQSA